ncbi:sigma 54-interacting transcriptional regulator [uncultured Aquimarina sp.]|uniref:sigma 54-interacting transcriptional regulator n=1 Tax=uncultured Aquimarina sp. TaxID=575652 RepID=UPI002613C4E3|nr:sigma 54-interacting transcriptional regulator [uncultured Aquimarina sp.]
MSNKELGGQDFDKDTLNLLLGISQQVSKVRDLPSFLKFSIQELKPIFGFYDVGVFLLDESGTRHCDLATLHPEISPSEANFAHYSNNINWEPQADSPLEYMMDEVIKAKGLAILDFDIIIDKFPDYPQMPPLKEVGFKEGLAANLSIGDQILGLFCMNTLEKGFFTKAQVLLFQRVVEILSVAISNIIFNTRLNQEKQFKEVLLGVSKTVANIHNRKELFEVIFNNLNPIFTIDDYAVIIINEQGTYWKDLTIFHGFPQTGTSASLRERGFDTWLHFNSLTKRQLEKTEILTIDDFKTHVDFPKEFLEVLSKDQLKEFMSTPMVVGNKTIGFLVLDSKKKGTYSKVQFPLFQAIADQLAVAVSNVLANEQLLEEKQFKETLLSISEAVATIQDRKELFKVIFGKVNNIIRVDDVGLVVLNQDGTKWKDLALSDNYHETLTNKKLAYLQGEHYNEMDSLVKHALKETEIYTIERLKSEFKDHSFNQIMAEAGLVEFMMSPLKVSNKIIGFISLDSKSYGSYSKAQFPLFRAISDQIAVAVSNVLGNEQLQKEKQFKETLLNISEAVASIQGRKELFSVIFEKVNTVIPVDDVGLLVLSPDRTRWKDLAVSDNYYANKGNKRLAEHGLAGYFDRDPLVEFCLSNTAIMSIEEMVDNYPENDFPPLMKEHGLKEFIITPLRVGNNTIGSIVLDSYKEGAYSESQFPLIKAIADLIAVAVSNVLGNEEILKREVEKTTLLKITESVARIQNLPEFLNFVMSDLKQVFNFHDVGVFLLTDDGKKHYDIAGVYPNISTQEWKEAFSNTDIKLVEHSQSAIEWVMNICEDTDGPYLFDFEDLVKRFPDYYQFQLEYFKETGYRDCLVANLKVGETTFGMFCINALEKNFYKEEQFKLFQNVTEQLSVAISNILAQDSILRSERKKSLEVNIVNILNIDQPWVKKCEDIIFLLNKFIDCSIVHFILGPSKTKPYYYTFERVASNEYRYWDSKGLSEYVGLSEREYEEERRSAVMKKGKDSKGIELVQKTSKSASKIANKFKAKSGMSVWFDLAIPGDYVILFRSKQANAYGTEDEALIKTIKPSIELALEKLFAFENVDRLNKLLSEEKKYLREEIKSDYNFENIIGNHISLKNAFEQVRQLAPMDINVLVTGETGTGKELIARAIHEQSPRKEKVLIKVNCATLPTELIESELFGHEKGAFTGATKMRVGKFELAHNSTVFLDEIGELTMEAQAKLLRVLQEKEFERVGGNITINSNFRVVAATNRDLAQEVRDGNFRSDLFYRLNGFQVYLTPLRERLEDAPLLAHYFAENFSHKIGKPYKSLSKESLLNIQNYDWPGNIRELKNRIEQALVVADSDNIIIDLRNTKSSGTKKTPFPFINVSVEEITMSFIEKSKDDIERALLLSVLEKTNWRVSGPKGAANLLGLKNTTLDYRMKKLGISR